MLIYDLLKMDHRMVIGIIDTIEMVDDSSLRKDIFSLMRTELVMHSKSEEDHFYDPMRERMKDTALVKTSEEEHQEIEQFLMKLQFSPAAGDEWLGDLRSLRALLQRHILKEETDIFHVAAQHFTNAQAADMAARFLGGKGRLGMENPFTVAAHKVKELIGSH